MNQSPIPEGHWRVLRQLCAQLEPKGVVWALTGSTSLALQGVPVTVHDIDVQTDAAGAYAVQACFAGQVTREVAFSATDAIRSHFGALAIDGIKVEIMGDIEKRAPGGEWEAAPDIASLRVHTQAEGLRIPVLPLAYEEQAYLRLGRAEKARLIRAAMERKGNRQMAYRAVIFDLFGTLVRNFLSEEYRSVLAEMATELDVPGPGFAELWNGTFRERAAGAYSGLEENLRFVCEQLGRRPTAAQVRAAIETRLAYARRTLVPREGAIETLRALRRAGLKVGLISDCSWEVPMLWGETPFAGLFDDTIFSCDVAMKKPDPRIYALACRHLGVWPEECLYVGDGSSHELTGAAAAGMTPVRIRVPGEDIATTHRIDEDDWKGRSISDLREALGLAVTTKERSVADQGVTVRPMQPDDVDAVRQIDVAAFTVYLREQGETENLPARHRENILAGLSINPGGCFIAEAEGKPVGYIFSRRWGSLGWIGVFGVHPDWHGRGAGKQLLSHAAASLEAAGCTTIGLETMPDREYNVGLYARRGLRPIYSTLILEKEISTGPAVLSAPPVALFSGLRESALTAIPGICDAARPGLDYTAEAQNVAEFGLGDTLLIGEPEPWAVAVVRTVPKREMPVSMAEVSALAVTPEGKPRLGEVLAAIEAFAAARGLSVVRVPANSVDWETVQRLLAEEYRVSFVALRFLHKGNYPCPPGVEVSRWAM